MVMSATDQFAVALMVKVTTQGDLRQRRDRKTSGQPVSGQTELSGHN
jgi:hypothetical protein